jgi:CMP-N-acetylneuraminic acid synthetase
MIVGLVAAKANSNRFKNKNKYLFNGYPLFWHSVIPLLESPSVNKVYVLTDSIDISNYCKNNDVDVIWRKKNATEDEEPLLNILKYAYLNLDIEYEHIVTIMANCPGHSYENVEEAIRMMQSGQFKEIRSFNNKNEESGLMIFHNTVIRKHLQISSHIGLVNSNAKEIHTKRDLNEIY